MFVAPIGKQHAGDVSAFVSRRKTAVARLFADDTHNLARVIVEDDDRDGESKVFEVLTNAEEIGSEVVLKQEVLDVLLHLCGAFPGVVLQACTIADFGIELLTSGERFIILDLADDVVGHGIVLPPRDKTLSSVENTAVKFRVLTEYFAAVRHKRHRNFGVRQLLYA